VSHHSGPLLPPHGQQAADELHVWCGVFQWFPQSLSPVDEGVDGGINLKGTHTLTGGNGPV